jgi:cell wall-associated NlpC family hydrolase
MAIGLKIRTLFLLCFAVIQLTGCGAAPKTTASSIPYPINEPSLSSSEARKVVIQEAATQIGKPYKLSGNSPREGFDCSGLVFYTYLKAGKLLPRRAEEQYLSAQKVIEVKPGDLVFFTTDSRGKHIDHVGIYLGQQQFIHAPGKGRAVSTALLTEDYWKKRFIGAGNYLED